MYKFEYALTEDDYLEFNKHFQRTSTSQQRAHAINRFGLPIICAMLGFYLQHAFEGTMFWVSIGVLVVVSLIWLMGYTRLVLQPMMRRMIRNLKKEGRLPFGEIEIVTFNDSHIHKATSVGERTVAYTAVERVDSTTNATYIYIGSMEALIMPHRIFESDQQRADLLRFIVGA